MAMAQIQPQRRVEIRAKAAPVKVRRAKVGRAKVDRARIRKRMAGPVRDLRRAVQVGRALALAADKSLAVVECHSRTRASGP